MPEEITTESPVVVTEAETIKTDKELIAEEEEAAAEVEGEKEATTEEAEEKPKKEKKEKKPVVLTSDWEEGKVYLYQSNRTPRVPSLFPRELLLETWLKLHGVPYENVSLSSCLTPRLPAKKERLPFVELNGEKIAGTDLLPRLAEKFEKNVSSHLTKEQLNIEHALVKMVENHLYWFLMDWRTESEDNTLKAYNLNLPAYFESKLPPALLSLQFKMTVCKKVQKQRREQGLANLPELAKEDLKVLSEMLAEKDFMFGSEVSMLDLVLFSVLALLVTVDPEYECEMRDWLGENHSNLLDLVSRLREKVWGDHWDSATGDSLDLNPHIPKPEPEEKTEEEPEQKEEEKEEGEGEKPLEEKSEDDKDGEKVEVVAEEEKETEKKSILESFRNLKSRVFSKSKKEDAGEPEEEKTEEKTEDKTEEEEKKEEKKDEEKPVEEKSGEDTDGEKVEVVEEKEKEKEKEKKSIKGSFKKLRTRVFSKVKKDNAGEPSEKPEVEEEEKKEEKEAKAEEEKADKTEDTEEKKEETDVEMKEEEKEEEKKD